MARAKARRRKAGIVVLVKTHYPNFSTFAALRENFWLGADL